MSTPFLAGSWAFPQTSSPGKGTRTDQRSTVPRTSDGQPDIQGMWQGIGPSPGGVKNPGPQSASALPAGSKHSSGSYNYGVFSETRSSTNLPGGIIDPPDGKLPLQDWAVAKQQEVRKYLNELPPRARLMEVVDTAVRCMPGVPFPMFMAADYTGLQILQYPGRVVIVSEWNHIYRNIPLDGRPHLGKEIRLWLGDSRGRWEGNTLIVDVTNFNGKGWFDRAGTPQSDAAHLVERFTVVDRDTIAYEVTVEDQKVATRPWKLAGVFTRAKPGYETYEYACHEGNARDLENMLR